MMSHLTRPVATLAAAALMGGILPLISTTAASAHTQHSAIFETAEVAVETETRPSEADVEAAFRLLVAIPDAVLVKGDEATRGWLVQNQPDIAGQRANILGCAGAVAWLIASTAIPAAKILKIKRLINTLGGVTSAVRLFWGASFSYEKIRALGGAAAALGAELLGVAAVKKACFS